MVLFTVKRILNIIICNDDVAEKPAIGLNIGRLGVRSLHNVFPGMYLAE